MNNKLKQFLAGLTATAVIGSTVLACGEPGGDTLGGGTGSGSGNGQTGGQTGEQTGPGTGGTNTNQDNRQATFGGAKQTADFGGAGVSWTNVATLSSGGNGWSHPTGPTFAYDGNVMSQLKSGFQSQANNIISKYTPKYDNSGSTQNLIKSAGTPSVIKEQLGVAVADIKNFANDTAFSNTVDAFTKATYVQYRLTSGAGKYTQISSSDVTALNGLILNALGANGDEKGNANDYKDLEVTAANLPGIIAYLRSKLSTLAANNNNLKGTGTNANREVYLLRQIEDAARFDALYQDIKEKFPGIDLWVKASPKLHMQKTRGDIQAENGMLV